MSRCEALEEMRQDMLLEAKEEEYRECMMRSDVEYFTENSNYNDVVEELQNLKATCNMYDVDFSEILNYVMEDV